VRCVRPRSVAALFVFFAAPAAAQLPLPQVEKGPSVRLASDSLIDRIEAFHSRMEKLRAERKEKNDRERGRLEELRRQYDDSLRVESNVLPPEGFDPAVAERVIEIVAREDELIDEAIGLAERALSLSRHEPEDDKAVVTFDDAIEVLLAARRTENEAAASEAIAERMQLASEVEADLDAGSSLADRLASHEWRLRQVEGDHAQAEALELAARARSARSRADSARARLRAEPPDVARAEKDLERTATEVRAKKEQLEGDKKGLRRAPPPKGLDSSAARALEDARLAASLARLDLVDRRRQALDAKVDRARARAVAIRSIAHRAPAEWPRELGLGLVSAQLAAFAQQRSSTDALIARIREREDELPPSSQLASALRDRRIVLEEALGAVRESYQHYEAIQVMHSLARPAGAGGGPMSVELAIILTLVVLISGGLLMTHGLRYIHRLVLPPTGKLHLSERQAARLDTTISLLWPVIVSGICGSVIVWPIWSLEITMVEALEAIDHPLFFVDETPVSVFSMIELLFAVWASVVLSRVIRDFLARRVYENLGWDIGLTNAVNTLVHYVVILVGIIVGIRFIGIGASSLAILFGILGIGIGFGLRNITENFISGLIILAERPIKIGDFIEIGESVEGQIESISARSTTVVTRDNVSVIIPNSEFVAQRVVNWSHGDPKVRIAIPVGVAYGSDTDLVRRTLLDVARKHGQVLKKPHAEVYFRSFGASSLDFVLLVWIDEQYHRFRIASDLHFAVEKAFRKVGIGIAFPQLDLHVKSVSMRASLALHPELAPDEGPHPDTLDLPDPKQKLHASSAPMSLPDGRTKGHKPT
jgi:small-conductance mechanosensitive channel